MNKSTTDTPRTDALSVKITRDGIRMLQEEIDSLELQLAHSLSNQAKAQEEVERLKEVVKFYRSGLEICWHAANRKLQEGLR